MSEPLQLVKIMRDKQVIGEYSLPEVFRFLAIGTLRTSAYYWHKGMPNWIKLSQLQEDQAIAKAREEQLFAEAVKDRLTEEARFNQRVDEAVRSRLAEARSKGAMGQGGKDNNLGVLGGVLFVGGVVGVVGAFASRDKAQSASDGITFLSGSRNYSKIDSSGYETFAFVAGAVALLGLGLIIAGLARNK
jgi:hypothetical protein